MNEHAKIFYFCHFYLISKVVLPTPMTTHRSTKNHERLYLHHNLVKPVTSPSRYSPEALLVEATGPEVESELDGAFADEGDAVVPGVRVGENVESVC